MKNIKQKISIIMPAHNESDHIVSSIEETASTFEEFGCSWELIILDDGSTDDTYKKACELLKKYPHRLIVKKNPYNLGKGRAIKKAMHYIGGDYVVWLDADIRVENMEKFIDRILKLFEDPEIVGATTNIYIYPEEETFFDRIFHWMVNIWAIRSAYWFGSARAKGECQIIRAATWKELGGYDSSLVVGEDQDMFKRLKSKGKVVFLKDINLFESPRRYRELGHLRVVFEWLANYLSFVFFKRSYSKKWKPIR